MRELQQILERVGFIAGGGLPVNSFNFFAQWGERATAYVQPARGRVAVTGWENEDVSFGKDVPREMISEAEALVRKYYKFRYFASVTVGGRRYWIMTLRRASSVYGFATVGSAPTPPQPTSDEWLWFKMPDGGTVTLTRNGTPTAVTLELSLDNGATWSEWVEVGTARTQILAAGQVIHVRNASATSTSFSLSNTDYYNFSLSDITYGGGDIRSLLCKIKDNAICTSHCLRNIFRGCTELKESPAFGFTELESHCYRNALQETGIEQSPVLIAVNIPLYAYQNMFSYCDSLKKVTTYMNQVDAVSLNNWLFGVYNTGDFYCPAELTIPTGDSGIPSGWTRHDI